MVKSCKELAKEIEELKENLKQSRTNYSSIRSNSDKKLCESINPTTMCSNCDCWKSAREYVS